MSQYQWKPITEKAEFAPRDGGGALVFKDRMWLLGGWNPLDPVFFPTTCNNEVWSSKDGATWRLELKHAPWEERHYAGYVVHRGKMWILGGDPNQGHNQGDIWNSADGIHWEKVCDPAPWGPRVLKYVVAFDDKIWIMGGQTVPQFAPAEEIFYSDVWNTSDGVNWKQVADDLPWAPRGLIGGSAVFQDRMWILGGGTYDTPKVPQRKFYNDVWSSADGVSWKQHTAGAPWVARQFHDVAVFDDRLWVMEGGDGKTGNLKDVWHSTDGANWTEVPNTPWLPRHAASVFVHDNALFMVTGNNLTSDCWKLTRVK